MSTIHQGLPIVHQGTELRQARAVVIMVHGRGGGVESILPLANHLAEEGIAFLAPSAFERTWYPQRFLAPRHLNEPYLSSALAAIGDVVRVIGAAGVPAERTILLGFSQGACLSLEYAARNPVCYGGVVALSGALIGAEEELVGYVGSLKGTPVLLGCSDRDDHIPLDRVYLSAEILQGLGATVDVRIYPGLGHTIHQDEIDAVRQLIRQLLA
jgi:predicted esterase